MTVHAIRFGDGKTVQGIVHISTVDAVFRTLDGRPIACEFHHYLGPAFFFGKDDTQDWLPDYETEREEWDNLWRQFEGWFKAKGHKLRR